jgi:glutamate-1-semialdehyde 2,1-aminomutase
VITGFRVSVGGAQQRLGVTPDLTVLGKAIANGFPVAALAGRADLMDRFYLARVVHGGTYNSHPLGMAATVATLNQLKSGAVHAQIERCGKLLMTGIAQRLQQCGVPCRVQGFPGIFHVSLGSTKPIERYADSLRNDRQRYVRFTTALVERGVRALERGAWFLSAAHDEAAIERTLDTVAESAALIAKE